MDMPHNPIATQMEGLANITTLVIDKEKTFQCKKEKSIVLQVQHKRPHKLLLLPQLHAKQMKGKKPLINYNISHVIILEKYLNIM